MTIRTKLLLLAPFAVLGMLFTIGAVFYGKAQVDEHEVRRDEVLETGAHLEEVRRLFLEARRAEKDFLLRADGRYVESHRAIIEELRQDFDDLSGRLSGIGVDRSQLDELHDGIDAYSAAFRALAEAHRELGLDHEAGLQGKLRAAAHTAEAALEGMDRPEMMVKLLMMRRHEKDFILRFDQKYLDQLATRVEECR